MRSITLLAPRAVSDFKPHHVYPSVAPWRNSMVQRFLQVLIAVGLVTVSEAAFAEIVEADVEIQSVDVEERLITVLLRSKTLEMEVHRRAKITVGDNKSTLESLKAGQVVRVVYDNDPGFETAKKIMANEQQRTDLAADKSPLAKAKQLNATALRLMDNGDYINAEEPFEEALQIFKKELGETHPDSRKAVNNLAKLYLIVAKTQEDVDLEIAAYAWRKLGRLRMPYDKNHWQVTDSRLGLQHVRFIKQFSDQQLQRWIEALKLSRTKNQLLRDNKVAEAKKAAKGIVDIRRVVLGEKNAQVADSMVDLAWLLDQTGEAVKARPLYEQAHDIYRTVLGKQHPRYATCKSKLAWSFERSGDYEKAKPLYEQALEIYGESLGTDHPEYHTAYDRLTDLLGHQARLHIQKDDLSAARKARKQILTLQTVRFGEEHFRTTDAKKDLEQIDTLIGQSGENRKRLAKATSLMESAYQRQLNGQDLASGIKDAEEAMKVREAILGKDDIGTAECIDLLGVMHDSVGDYENAKTLYLAAKRIRGEQLGRIHPFYATSVNNLAELYRKVGEYENARPLYDEALKISRRWSTEHPENLATSLNNLALFFHDKGEYEKAKPLYEEALTLIEETTEQWPMMRDDYATYLNNTAELCRVTGDMRKAKVYYDDAKEIREGGPDYASSLNNLGLLYHEVARSLDGAEKAEKFEQAKKLYLQALEISESSASPVGQPEYAIALTNLANLYHDVGKFTEAGKRYEEALKLRREILSENHPDVASSIGNLAAHYRSLGRFDEAEQHYKQALAVLKDALGETHPVYGVMLRNLAKLYESKGEPGYAVPDLRKSLEIAREKLELTAAVQSERQQLGMAKMFRGTLDRWLSLSTRTELPADETYEHVLRWKGAVFARQLEQRKYRRTVAKSADPKVASLVRDLKSVACRIAALALSEPPAGQEQSHWQRLGELSRKKEELEAKLATVSPEFRKQQAVSQLTLDQLKELLPTSVVLVDLLEYRHSSPPPNGKGRWKTERRLMAFVVRRGEPIRQLELGSVEPIAKAVTEWLRTTDRPNPIVKESDPSLVRRIAKEKNSGTVLKLVDQMDSAIVLRELFWKKIERHLPNIDESSPKVEELFQLSHVLVSPDGALARMPLVALPGREPNTYLIEERAISTIAVPQLLPELLASEEDIPREPSMLLIGDVDYDANLSDDVLGEEEDASSRRQLNFLTGYIEELKATGTEINDIALQFEDFYKTPAVRLTKEHASESTVREEAPKHYWLHFATHGFFAPSNKHSALAAVHDVTRSADMTREAEVLFTTGVGGFHPGVLSGIVLAGVNRPIDDGSNDGILTAMEVAEMDLQNVKVVVLSACDTGLGDVAGGEGVLGIQRAFQMAGAKTVVASLWKVDDKATQQLMSNFYKHMWDHEKLGKLAAFRKSQLMMLGPPKKRGLDRGKEREPKDLERPAPFKWAAFSISGDWR